MLALPRTRGSRSSWRLLAAPTSREIAQSLGRSEAATRTLLTRARQKVRARLDPPGRDHDRARSALELASAMPAFPLDAAERRELGCIWAGAPTAPERVRIRAVLASVGRLDPALSARLHDRIREAASTAPHSGPNAVAIFAILVLLAVGMIGASSGRHVPRPGGQPPAQARTFPSVLPMPSTGRDVVALAAGGRWIDADAQAYSGRPRRSINSDPGRPRLLDASGTLST